MTRTFSWAVLAVGLWALVPASTSAQQGAPGRGDVDRTQLEERIRLQLARVTRERLGLDEAEAARLSEVVRSFDGRRRELLAEEQATRRRVEALLAAGSTDQSDARELLTRMSELRRQEADLFREEQDALLQVLTPVQLLTLQELRQDFGRRIRALDDGRGGRPGVGRGGASPGARQEFRRRGALRAQPGTQPLL